MRTLDTEYYRLTNVHDETACVNEPCVVHHPSEHHMVDWLAHWRGDRRIVERICRHGIGHPDPDDAKHRARNGDFDSIHGCDGCCVDPAIRQVIRDNG